MVEQLPVIFTMDEALRAGFTADQVRRKVARGEWVALRAGVYATAGALARVGHDDRRRHWIDVAAAQRAIRVPAWASHESAAFLQGLPMPRAPRDVVRLTCLPGGRGSRWEPPRPGPTPRPGLLIRRAAMPAGHRAVALGVPATTAARTVVDLARRLPRTEAVAAGDAALRIGLTTRGELEQVIHDSRSWPGLDQARGAVDLLDGKRETALESRSFVMFADWRLPLPECQVWIADEAGELFARVDFLWRQHRVIGEADGKAKYAETANGHALWEEKRRQERLEDLGFVVVRWGWDDVETRPDLTVERIRRAFARAARVHGA